MVEISVLGSSSVPHPVSDAKPLSYHLNSAQPVPTHIPDTISYRHTEKDWRKMEIFCLSVPFTEGLLLYSQLHHRYDSICALDAGGRM